MLNDMYRFTDNFAAGLRWEHEEKYDESRYAALIKFTSGNTHFGLIYFPDDDYWGKEYQLSFFKTF
jgi:hypothetical protein